MRKTNVENYAQILLKDMPSYNYPQARLQCCALNFQQARYKINHEITHASST
jgi:hypothetical protein